jgi:hypothetical protein
MKTIEKILSIEEVVARFNELAQEEKWFEIQDELFAENVKSIEPEGALHLQSAEGKQSVRNKAETFVNRIQAFHSGYTTQPLIAGNHFVVGRGSDITVDGIGRLEAEQLMVYKVENGKIVLEQFFY